MTIVANPTVTSSVKVQEILHKIQMFFFLFPFSGSFKPRRRVATNVLTSQRKDYDTLLTQTKFGKMTPQIIFQFLEAAPQPQIV